MPHEYWKKKILASLFIILNPIINNSNINNLSFYQYIKKNYIIWNW